MGRHDDRGSILETGPLRKYLHADTRMVLEDAGVLAMKRKIFSFDLVPFLVGMGGLTWLIVEIGWKPALAVFVMFLANGLETHGKREWKEP